MSNAAYKMEWRGAAPRLPRPVQLAREGSAGADWYQRSNASLVSYARSVGTSVERVAGILAVTSPRVHVRRNVALTRGWIEHGSTDGMMRQVARACRRFDDTGEIRGPKVGAFARALMLDEQAIVVDVWMVRAYGLPLNITPKRYRVAASKIRHTATLVGMTPAQAQAAVWCSVRRRYGFVSDSPVTFGA